MVPKSRPPAALAYSTPRPAGASAAARRNALTGALQRSRTSPRSRASATTACRKARHHLVDWSCGPVVSASAGTMPSTASPATWSSTIRS
jgi:hypothetical protein